MKINMDSINAKIQKYAKSPAGQRKIEQAIGGAAVVNIAEMNAAAQEMIDILRKTAASHGLPESVMDHFSSLSASAPREISPLNYEVQINFSDDMSRQSLYQKKYDGVDNIVAVYNNGYHAHDYVYGRRVIDGWVKYITSRTEREGLHFMQEAVNEFNRVCGPKYNVIATLSGEYK